MRLATNWFVTLLLLPAFVGCGGDGGGDNGTVESNAGGGTAAVDTGGRGDDKSTDDASTDAETPAKVPADEAYVAKMRAVGEEINYLVEEDGYFPAHVSYVDETGQPRFSWRVRAYQNLMFQKGRTDPSVFNVKWDEGWDTEGNAHVLENMPEEFQSPGVDEPGHTTLMVLVGPTTPFDGEYDFSKIKRIKGPTPGDFEDGRANVILAVYAPPEKAVPWTKPVDLEFDRDDPLACVRPVPESGLLVLMADGSVHRLPKDVSPELFRNLVEHQDGNTVEIP